MTTLLTCAIMMEIVARWSECLTYSWNKQLSNHTAEEMDNTTKVHLDLLVVSLFFVFLFFLFWDLSIDLLMYFWECRLYSCYLRSRTVRLKSWRCHLCYSFWYHFVYMFDELRSSDSGLFYIIFHSYPNMIR